jgi:hypothetical protein
MGGTLMQLIVPSVFIIYFFFHGQRYSSALTGIWLAGSFFGISIYARDAWVMELPLLGGVTGDTDYHDWNIIVSELNMIGQIQQIADAFYYTGILVLAGSIAFGIYYSLKSDDMENFA